VILVEGPAQNLVTRFYDEVLNEKHVERIDELLAPDFVEHGTPPLEGRDAFRAFVEGLVSALPDFRFQVNDWIVEGDRVVARCSATGTHRGVLFGFAPTGKRVSWTAIHIWRVTDGRLAERWSEADRLGIVEQVKPAE
jgi:steroid delta-isomerase-like uncharacterized protein